MIKVSMRYTYILALLLLLFGFDLQAKQIPPRSNTIVTDYAGTLTAAQRMTLERKLVAFDDTSSTQIAVVIENSLEGDDIFDYSYRLAEGWGIGRDGKDNGVLLYVAIQDRDIYIQTGYGAEGFLPDAMVKRIIDNIILPNFRNGNYYQGLDEGTNVIMQLAAGEYTNEGGRKESSAGTAAFIFLLLLVLVVLFSIFNRGNNDDWDDDGGYSGRGRYDDYDDYGGGGNRRRGGRRARRSSGGGWIFLPGGGFGGGGGGWDGGGGFGGGGFGGFGGGGFGGGGAGGSW